MRVVRLLDDPGKRFSPSVPSNLDSISVFQTEKLNANNDVQKGYPKTITRQKHFNSASAPQK